jgi:hypothetical protein
LSRTFPICSDEAQFILKIPIDRGCVQHVNEFFHPLLLRNVSPGFLATLHMVLRTASTCVPNFTNFYLFSKPRHDQSATLYPICNVVFVCPPPSCWSFFQGLVQCQQYFFYWYNFFKFQQERF